MWYSYIAVYLIWTGLEALSIKLDLEENNKISTKDLLETAWFVLRNNNSESDSMI